MGDGAYESLKLTNAILNKQPEASIIIPPPTDAVISQDGNTQRDQNIRLLKEVGRIAWQKENEYGLRSHVELCMLRYKKIIGPNMKAMEIPQKKTEGGIAVRVLNRMTSLCMQKSVKVTLIKTDGYDFAHYFIYATTPLPVRCVIIYILTLIARLIRV